MKTDYLLEDFSSYEVLNEQMSNIIGGTKISPHTRIVSGTGSYNGQTTVDITLYN